MPGPNHTLRVIDPASVYGVQEWESAKELGVPVREVAVLRRPLISAVIPLTAVADAAQILFHLGRTHRLFPTEWAVSENTDGTVTMTLSVHEFPDGTLQRFLPQAVVMPEVLR